MKLILTCFFVLLLSNCFGQVPRLHLDTIQISTDLAWNSKYESIEPFSPDGIAVAAINDKYGYVDTSGHELCPFIYDDILIFDKGIGGVSLNNKWALMNIDGVLLTAMKYEQVGDILLGTVVEDRIRVSQNGKWGFLDKNGKEVIPLIYDEACSFMEELSLVKKSGKCGFIDIMGNIVISLEYEDASPFSEGLAAAKKKGKVGFIDKNNKTIIPFEFDDTGNFYDGLAYVRKNGKFGFVDKKGVVVIPLIYDMAEGFFDDSCLVTIDGRCFYIDRKGDFVKNCH